MENVDWAWFAGFFEGEGCVRLASRAKSNTNGRHYAVPSLDICQVNREPLDKALKLFPGGKIYGPYQYATNKQPHYKYMVQGRIKVEAIFQNIKPYLSQRRIKQFEETLAAHAKLVDRPRLKTGPKPKGVA